ncbi:MAG TPA: hypothetical protein VLB74_12230, partial [Flavobacterium sp.]|uniref:hypothetical protein n=1 Tax=Flavobacterium sp. TaxID=239 RepID=UPI002BE154E7
MRKTIKLLLLVLLTSNFILGQNNNAVKSISQINTIEESVYLHCNTTTILCGETLLYKIYALNTTQKKFSSISKIGYVELLDESNQSVMKQKIALKNGTGQGDYFITTSLKTGNYKLVTYTNWTRNKKDKGIYKTDIFIVNPFERLPLKESEGVKSSEKSFANNIQSEKKESTPEPGNITILAKTDKTKYAFREKISLTLSSESKNDIKGNFSVSVRKKDSLPLGRPITSVDFLNLAAVENGSNIEKSKFLPELRGEIISGRIVAINNSNDLKDKTVSLSIPGKNFGMKLTKTDESGKFNFILDDVPETSGAIIQIIGKDRNDYTIELNEMSSPDFSKLIVLNPLWVHSKNKSDLEQRSIANQVENNYYQQKKDSLLHNQKTPAFYHSLEKEYILDDYTRFPTLKETIIEILAGVYYTKNEQGYTIHLRDSYGQSDAYGETMVMVDGLIIEDANELFDYDMQNIYKVSLVNRGYVYGPKVFNGIINFITKKNDFQTKASGNFIKTVTLDRPQAGKKYF